MPIISSTPWVSLKDISERRFWMVPRSGDSTIEYERILKQLENSFNGMRIEL